MAKLLELIPHVSKAIAAAVTAAGAAYAAAQVAGPIGAGEWITVGSAAVGAFIVAYLAPRNTTPA